MRVPEVGYVDGATGPAGRAGTARDRGRHGVWWRARHNASLLAGGAILTSALAVACLAPLLAPHGYNDQHLSWRLLPPFSSYRGQFFLLGTDQLGRDVFSRIVFGARVSMLVGTVGVATGAVAGTAIGLTAGWVEDWRSGVLMRIADVQLAFPYLLLAIAIIGVLGPNLINLIIVLGLRTWVGFARIVRAAVLEIKAREFVESAQASGGTPVYVVLRHILPNMITPILVLASVEFGNLVLLEATLSFLGLGVRPPFPSWGTMLSDARDYLFTQWWLSIPPGVAIMLTVLGANVLGDGLRDLLDPKVA